MDNNSLFILGNGFDVDLGWFTKYNDFYQANKGFLKQYSEGTVKWEIADEMVKGEYWYDIEGYIRNCLLKLTDPKDYHNLWNFVDLMEKMLKNYILDKDGKFQVYD